MDDAGQVAGQAGLDTETLERLMEARFSCRAFTDRPVPDETIRRILSMAGRAASWCNTQPWHLTVTRPAATRRLAAALHESASRDPTPAPDLDWPADYPGVYGERRRASGYGLYAALGIAREDYAARHRQALENFRFFGAPHAAILTAPRELGNYGLLDCGGFIAAFMLAARACGVDSCAQAAIAGQAPLLRQLLELPSDRLVVCAIAFGHADESHPANRFRADRAEFDELAEWLD